MDMGYGVVESMGDSQSSYYLPTDSIDTGY